VLIPYNIHISLIDFTSPLPLRSGGVRSVAISVSVCLSVCLTAGISRKSHTQISPNIPYMLPVAVAQSFSDGSAISYVYFLSCGRRHHVFT